MISAKLMGGIGNQLFQIAAAHSLALRNNDQSCFDFEKCFTPLQGFVSNRYSNNILKNVINRQNIKIDKKYYEPCFSYKEIPYQNNLEINGYFQSENYFSDFKNDIINLFLKNLKNDTVNDYIRKLGFEFTTVHIRRGDYSNNISYHNIIDIEYYKKAIKLLGNKNYIFISDEIDWVKKNFKAKNFYYSPFSDDFDDLYLMIKSENTIIANSSFSWWGGYLNENKNKIIISPDIWFGINGPKDTQDLRPKNWIKI